MVSQRFVVFACISVILGTVSAPVVYANIIIVADQSCRTLQSSPDTNAHSTGNLTVRTTVDDPTRTYKSWIKFNISELDVNRLATATLTLTLASDRGDGQNFYVSYINDDCLDNIDWDTESLTWNNAPGNNTSSIGGLDTDKTTELAWVSFFNGIAGDAFTIDVFEALASDTDGIVQFILHNSSALMSLAGHDHAEEAWRPFIDASMWPKHMAIKPSPAMNENEVYKRPVLSWTPGEYVEGLSPRHKIFFSENFNDVSNGVGGVTQDANEYLVPSPLDFDKTYYWRVDEANSVSGWDQGVVWSFTVEPEVYPLVEKYITVMASSNEEDAVNTINGSGLNDDDQHMTGTTTMWLSGSSDLGETWIRYDFDKPYKLHQMLVWNYNGPGTTTSRYGFRNAKVEHSLDGTNWTALDNVPTFTRAPGSSGYASDIVVDFNDLIIKQVRITALNNWSLGGSFDQYGLSEVRFLVLPLYPRQMSPAQNSTDVDLDVILSWRSGRDAETHEVHFGSSPSNLPLAEIVTGAPYAAYDTTEQNLQLGQTYYWQVKEVNTLEIPATWEGDILKFTTREFLVVEDFESYGNTSPYQPFQSWLDGLGYPADDYFPQAYNGNGTGAVIGHDIESLQYSTYMERSIVHSGSQSMPLYYDNGNGISEVTRTFDPRQDWTVKNVTTLSLWYYGDPNNTAERMYVALNGDAVVNNDDTNAALVAEWTQWDIDLQLFADQGVDLTSVSSMTIGFGNKNNPQTGGLGMVLFDDIGLYPAKCILSNRSADFARIDYVEDCIIDYKELDILATEWLTRGSDLTSDLNEDNVVDLKDYAVLAEHWFEQQLWP